MDTQTNTLVLVLATLATVILCAWLTWRRLSKIEMETLNALRSMQLQLAFIAGRIGLSKRDLDRAVDIQDTPDVPTEVTGDYSGWYDGDEEGPQHVEPSAPTT